MKIAILGTGYVGLVTGVCFSNLGFEVTCFDVDKNKINLLKSGKVPFFEFGLEDMVERNVKRGNLDFADDITKTVNEFDIVFIAVGTPSKKNGEVDLSFVEKAVEDIAKNLKSEILIVNKSTVPVGSGEMIKKIVKKYYKGDFEVASNPEFLREGSAIKDFMEPERIVIGTSSKKAEKMLKEVYSFFECPIVSVSIETSEMIKYASNAFLATKISFINEISNVCEKVGANVEDVSYAMGLDSRIGDKFLKAGIGYGGSCFPKDVKGLKNIALKNHYQFELLEAVIRVNNSQKGAMIFKAKQLLGNLKGKNIAIWGLAFKPNTDDFRESVAISLIKMLLDEGVNINVYDPMVDYNKVREEFDFMKKINFFSDMYEALNNCDALMIATEWDEFKKINLKIVKNALSKANIIDGRNIFDTKKMEESGFAYLSIGR